MAAGGGLSTLGTIASIGSAIIGGFGAIQQGRAASASANYNAQVAANNAKIAQQNATWAGQAGEAQAAASEAKTRAAVGATQAAQGASGVDVNSGSASDVRASQAEIGMLDALTIRSNAARQAYGYQTQSASDTAQSKLDKSQAKNDSTAGLIGGGATLLGGLGTTAMNYGKFIQSNSLGAGDTFSGGSGTDTLYG